MTKPKKKSPKAAKHVQDAIKTKCFEGVDFPESVFVCDANDILGYYDEEDDQPESSAYLTDKLAEQSIGHPDVYYICEYALVSVVKMERKTVHTRHLLAQAKVNP